MRRVKKRTFSGCVCEQEIYNIGGRAGAKSARPRLRFRDEAEREEHKLGISRRNHARIVNANFKKNDLYVTLTFDNYHEVHTFPEARRVRDRFFRRLRYAYPNAVIMIYMGRGKSTSRIHFHMLIAGVPDAAIRKLWREGSVLRITPLRENNYYNGVDHGQDFTGLANYLFDHWTPEQGGHRWKQTRNAAKPEMEEPTEAVREYSESKPPRAPKGYILVETKATRYGYLYYKYIRDPDKHKRQRRIT